MNVTTNLARAKVLRCHLGVARTSSSAAWSRWTLQSGRSSYSTSNSNPTPGESHIGERTELDSSKSSDLANTEGASLPLAQRCKNLLVSNWRGQLNTVKAGSDKKDAASVHSSVVEYTLLDGKPLVWLPPKDQHQLNIMLDDRGSLLVGQTDPPPLVKIFRHAQKVPPRVILLADLVRVDPSEAEYMRRRLRKLAEASSLAVEQAGAATRRVLAAGGPAVSERVEALVGLADAVPDFAAYRLYSRSCNFVEAAAKHAVAVGEMAGAAPDPLAVIQVALLEGLNRSPAHRRAFVMFCAAHMRTHAEDAFIYSADRWGFNLLANIVLEGEEGSAQWKEYRFGFQSEVRDAEGFCLVLEEMEKEIGAAVSEDKQ